MMKPTIRAKQVAISGDVMVVVDDQGRAWERREHMPEGAWGQIPLPAQPQSARRRKANVRKR